MTEQQPYDVVHSYDVFELRRYPEHVVAEVDVDAPFEDAGNRAFRYLFSYISGDNESQTKVAMTAPVVQADTSSKIAMTAPVVQQTAEVNGDTTGEGPYRVAFVLPATLNANTAPQPTNPRVQLRVVPQSLVAAITYRGRWTKEKYSDHRDQLQSALVSAGLTPVGQPRFARFDPPLKPAFLRRNDVMLDVVEASGRPAP